MKEKRQVFQIYLTWSFEVKLVYIMWGIWHGLLKSNYCILYGLVKLKITIHHFEDIMDSDKLFGSSSEWGPFCTTVSNRKQVWVKVNSDSHVALRCLVLHKLTHDNWVAKLLTKVAFHSNKGKDRWHSGKRRIFIQWWNTHTKYKIFIKKLTSITVPRLMSFQTTDWRMVFLLHFPPWFLQCCCGVTASLTSVVPAADPGGGDAWFPRVDETVDATLCVMNNKANRTVGSMTDIGFDYIYTFWTNT